MSPPSNRPPWIRTWKMLSIAWGLVLVGLTVKALVLQPSFEAAASEPCPQFLLRLAPSLESALQRLDQRLFFKVLVWRDARSRAEISPYRAGEQALTCNTLEARAKVFQVAAQLGVIQPHVHLRTKVLALLIVLSSLLLAPIVYLAHLPFARND